MRLHLIGFVWLGVIVLTACARGNALPQTVEPLPPAFRATPFATALASPGGTTVVTVGYYYDGGNGAVLVDALSFSGDQPAPLNDQLDQQVWLGGMDSVELQHGLRTGGAVRYAPLLAAGQLEGPGAYGPDGRYAFALSNPRLSLLVPVVLTVTALLERSATYEGQFVRVKGALISNVDSALLADQLEPGGVPTTASRQIKLAEPIRDTQLLARLQASTRGIARYGEVEIEGFWRKGTLFQLGIVPL